MSYLESIHTGKDNRLFKEWSKDPKPSIEPVSFEPWNKAPEKPKDITGPLSAAWDYLANRGCCRTTEFDEDFEPIGPSLRSQLSAHGVIFDTSDGVTIMFFP